jgi:hypothetical protein
MFNNKSDIEVCHRKYMQLCNKRKVIKRNNKSNGPQFTFMPAISENSTKILEAKMETGSRKTIYDR